MKRLFILLTAITALYSCQKEESLLTVTPNEITLYTKGTQQIITNAKSAIYSSQDEFYASVEQDGLVTANKVGSTLLQVSANGKTQIIPITILSKYTLYPELDQLIGKTKSDVMAKLGSSYTENNDMWTYKNLTSYASVGVKFKDGKVENAAVLVSTQYTSQLADYLIERYAIAGMQNDYYYFFNHDKNVVVSMTVYSISYLGVVYMAYTDSKATDIGTLKINKELFDVFNMQ